MNSTQKIRRELDRRRARCKVMDTYLEAYELLADTNTFSNPNMAGKSAMIVNKQLKKEQQKIQELRRKLNGD